MIVNTISALVLDMEKIQPFPPVGSSVLLSVPDESNFKSFPNMDQTPCLNMCFFGVTELKACYYNATNRSCNIMYGTAFLLLDNKMPASNDPVTGLRKNNALIFALLF